MLDAGFTPREIFISCRGKLLENDGKPAFQPIGSGQLFPLVENAELTNLKSEGLKEAAVGAKVIGEEPPLSLEI